MQRRRDSLGYHPGAEPSRGAPSDSAIEDELHLAGPPDVQVLADDLLEEDAPVHRPVQHLRQRELGPQDRHTVAVASPAITSIERMGQSRQPLAQQRGLRIPLSFELQRLLGLAHITRRSEVEPR